MDQPSRVRFTLKQKRDAALADGDTATAAMADDIFSVLSQVQGGPKTMDDIVFSDPEEDNDDQA